MTLSLKSRITLAVIAVLALVTTATGSAVYHGLNTYLLDRLDARLLALSYAPTGGGSFPAPDDRDDDDDEHGSHKEEHREPGGETLLLAWSGTDWVSTSYEPGGAYSPPALPRPGSAEYAALQGVPTTLLARDGSTAYRVVAAPDPAQLAVASDLSGLEATERRLLTTLLVTGGLAILLGGVLVRWLVSRSLRPVTRMIDTAAKIAEGDLGQRVEAPQDGTELARLGEALDAMLSQLEDDALARERTEARLRQFVADASHELRTPVAAISGYAELYRQGGILPGEGMDRAFGRIESESARMGRLIEDLLLLTRLDREPDLRREHVSLAALAREAVAAFSVMDTGRTIEIEVESGGSAFVSADPARLRQVIDNLLRNAIVHTPAGTPISVIVGASEPWGRLEVRDHGPGVPVEEREAIFERFHRGDPSRARSTGGHGLGLSIVKAIVDAHGGTVHVDGAREGGACFVVRIPLVPMG